MGTHFVRFVNVQLLRCLVNLKLIIKKVCGTNQYVETSQAYSLTELVFVAFIVVYGLPSIPFAVFCVQMWNQMSPGPSASGYSETTYSHHRSWGPSQGSGIDVLWTRPVPVLLLAPLINSSVVSFLCYHVAPVATPIFCCWLFGMSENQTPHWAVGAKFEEMGKKDLLSWFITWVPEHTACVRIL